MLSTLLQDAAWITAISALLSVLASYFIAKMNNKKEKELNEQTQFSNIVVNERNRLSEDQIQIISELKNMILEQKEEINALRGEIKELQIVNIKLTIENSKLQGKIDELNLKLSRIQGGE